jgi:hypothetical protein
MPTGKARRVAAPALSGVATEFGPADYSVAFTVPAAGSHDAESWARTTFGSAPAALRPVLLFGWRFILRLQLGASRSPDHVLGWSVAENRPDTFAMTAPSPLLTAMNVVLVDTGSVTWVTLVRHRRPVGRLLWSAAALVHQWTIPYLLDRASKALEPAG